MKLLLKDIPFIAECLEDLHEESPTYNDVPIDREYVLSNLETMLFNDKFVGVKIGDGFMIGMIGSQWYDPREDCYEQLLYVKPEARKGMLALRLIKAFEQEAKSRGARRVFVGASVGIRDERTEGLYERLGYKWIGRSLVKEL